MSYCDREVLRGSTECFVANVLGGMGEAISKPLAIGFGAIVVALFLFCIIGVLVEYVKAYKGDKKVLLQKWGIAVGIGAIIVMALT